MFSLKLQLAALLAALALLVSANAQAQATRTWVSGVGDDANPCSRTAPCKTFAGAISKTAAGGEISVLDPGGFGAVTITKAITINGEGTLAGILAAGTNGIIVNAGANDVVVIRNISINGVGTGLDGVRFLAGKELHLERVQISGFTSDGVEFLPSGTSSLFINDSYITRVTSTALTNAAVVMKPGAAGKAFGVITNSRIEGNHIGLRVESRSDVTLQSSVLSRNAQFGAWALITSGGTATIFSSDSTFAYNGPSPLVATGTGIRSEGAGATVRLAKSTITGSELALGNSGGAILSYGDNRVSGNTSDGAPTGFLTDI